jgi:hypothetical protein
MPVSARARPFAFTWGQTLGHEDCPFVRRWKLRHPFGAIHVHHFLRSNSEGVYHDHPWWFLTIVLRGAYVDHSPGADGSEFCDRLRAGSVRLRHRDHVHRVETDGAWTLVFTGRSTREPQFWTRRLQRWFGSVDPLACDESQV